MRTGKEERPRALARVAPSLHGVKREKGRIGFSLGGAAAGETLGYYSLHALDLLQGDCSITEQSGV